MIAKCPMTVAVMNSNARPAFASRNNSPNARVGSSPLLSRCPRTAGMRINAIPQMTLAIPASIKNGVSHRNNCASFKPNGTPNAAAAENAVITMPIPAARRSGGTTSPMIDMIIAIDSPPKVPLTPRASNSVAAFVESPQKSVPQINPPYANSSNFLRSNRSINGAATRPKIPEQTV